MLANHAKTMKTEKNIKLEKHPETVSLNMLHASAHIALGLSLK